MPACRCFLLALQRTLEMLKQENINRLLDLEGKELVLWFQNKTLLLFYLFIYFEKKKKKKSCEALQPFQVDAEVQSIDRALLLRPEKPPPPWLWPCDTAAHTQLLLPPLPTTCSFRSGPIFYFYVNFS